MKILIADDSPIARLTLKKSLNAWGYDVDTCEDGLSAWERIHQSPPEIAIIDWEMPAINGIDLCKMIQEDESLPYIYLIMITARNDTAEIVTGLEAGADDYIIKPPAKEVLRSRVAVGVRTVEYEKSLAKKNEQLQLYSSEMEKLVEERSKQLAHSDRIATVGMLAAGVAHEINNPLTFISTNLQVLTTLWADISPALEKCETDEETQDQLDFALEEFPSITSDMQDGVTRITRIVEGLKAFTHKKHTDKPEPCDINNCIDHALDLCHNALKYHVEIIKDLDESLNQVLADSQQIEQVLVNLCINAADAMQDLPNKDGKLYVTTENQDDKVLLTVADTGPGIPQQKLKDIWQPFFTTKPVGKGTGLGLPISMNIIEEHNGTIKVANQETGGAVFTIALPASSTGDK